MYLGINQVDSTGFDSDRAVLVLELVMNAPQQPLVRVAQHTAVQDPVCNVTSFQKKKKKRKTIN